MSTFNPVYRATVVYSNASTGQITVRIPSLAGADSTFDISYIGRAAVSGTWSVPDIGDQIVVTADDPNFTNTFWLQTDPASISVGLGNVSLEELGYLDGVTSAIQTQLNTKAPSNSPTFTGTVSLPSGAITSDMIFDGTIVNGDISPSANIALSKLSPGALPTGITVNSSNIVDGSVTASDTNFGGAWTAFTPTCSNTTVTASDCRYQVIGKTAFVSIMLQTTGTSTSTFQTLGGLPAAITPRGWSGFQEWKVIGSGSFSTVNHGFWYVKRDGTLEYRSAYAPGAPSYYVTFTGTQILGTVYLTGNLTYEVA